MSFGIWPPDGGGGGGTSTIRQWGTFNSGAQLGGGGGPTLLWGAPTVAGVGSYNFPLTAPAIAAGIANLELSLVAGFDAQRATIDFPDASTLQVNLWDLVGAPADGSYFLSVAIGA